MDVHMHGSPDRAWSVSVNRSIEELSFTRIGGDGCRDWFNDREKEVIQVESGNG
jgi:hypothetical protein